jgi:hypothetical protein
VLLVAPPLIVPDVLSDATAVAIVCIGEQSCKISVDRAPRRCQRRGVVSESLGLTSHKPSCNCTGCGMLRAGVCINCAEKIAPLILESGLGELAVEPCSGACREAIELYFVGREESFEAPG